MAIFYLKYIVPGCVLFPLGFFMIRYRVYSLALRILFYYLLISSVINLCGILLVSHNQSNLWLLHIYTIVEAEFLLFFFLSISKHPSVSRFIQLLLVLFPALCVANMCAGSQLARFNIYPRSAEALLFTFLSVKYWLDNNRQEYERWSADPLNWIISGLLLYFASSFTLFLLSDMLFAGKHVFAGDSLISFVWAIHGTLVIVQYLLFTRGFSKYKI